ncbi:hypothetical protein [Deinococcus multiflagellatus]|uniref:Uncharacterized protein n=1 Tax=Deinococcus multiflagellatus TaxID=1656887 RepID=A0ABW1ZS54_9DEIO|nr:hypothetical protein [Deinococcus multiflagellatus]MBZ9714503.1 hypothetical protein [Deinococcus multiflagellatus]
MTQFTDDQLAEYLTTLELADVPAALVRRDLTLTDDTEQGLVDAGSLVSFVAGLSKQTKADVLNSTLLAQLAANKAYDRENDTDNWYKKYREVLENIGWVISEFKFTKYQASGTTLQIKKVVLELLAAIMSENPLAVTKATLDAVESLGDGDDRVALFSSNSSNSSSGNFQVAAVVEDKKTPTMMIGAFYFKSNDVKVNFLWAHFQTSNTSLYQGTQTLTLDEDVYARVRQQIIDKLGERATQYIADLDI